MNARFVHLSPRLQTACDLLQGSQCVADIGCDHGRLAMALLQSGACKHVVATDISRPSLEKAERLASITGLSERITIRLGDGLSVLKNGECDAVAMLGMGGTLMARMLTAADPQTLERCRLVLQPMRAFSDIRRYLHQNGYHITDDRVVRDGARYYQVFAAVYRGTQQPVPQGWPEDFYELGFVAWFRRDANLPALAAAMLEETRRRLRTAVGSEGEERLRKKECALLEIAQDNRRKP